MSSKSKTKGNSWEREVANHLSELYKSKFIRVPSSGAFVGGKNKVRKEFLHEGQIRLMKGDIIPPDKWKFFNCECKSYADFPFHQVLAGDCKVLDGWLDQMMDVADENDFNVLFMKFNRKGRFVVVQSKYTFICDQFLYFTSKNHKDWLIIEFDHFWKHNQDLIKTYSNKSDTTSIIKSETKNLLPSLNLH